MVHTKVYGYCDAKCKVEVAPKETVDQIDTKLDGEIVARAEAIAGVQAEIDRRVRSRQVIELTDGHTIYEQILNMNIGDEFIFGKMKIPVGTVAEWTLNLSMGVFTKIDNDVLGGRAVLFEGDINSTYGTVTQIQAFSGNTLRVVFSKIEEDGSLGQLNQDLNDTDITDIEDCYVIKNGINEGAVNLNYETWTFTLDDGTTVTKEVCVR